MHAPCRLDEILSFLAVSCLLSLQCARQPFLPHTTEPFRSTSLRAGVVTRENEPQQDRGSHTQTLTRQDQLLLIADVSERSKVGTDSCHFYFMDVDGGVVAITARNKGFKMYGTDYWVWLIRAKLPMGNQGGRPVAARTPTPHVNCHCTGSGRESRRGGQWRHTPTRT